MITFDEFKKVEMRVAKVLEAEKLEGSEKLMKLQVDLGEEKRQIVAGIAKHYEPEYLKGRQILIATNLEPRKLMGEESNGMVLAADSPDGPVILAPEKEVPNGAIVK